MIKGEQILFVMPTPKMLRAGAIWVEVKNWCGAVQALDGLPLVMTPQGLLSAQEVESATSTQHTPGKHASATPVRRIAETALKDLRALLRMSRFNRRIRQRAPEFDPLLVWQHHDLFQQAGVTLARSYGRPLVLFVDAPQVWEARRWGVNRPGWGRLVERFGEVRQFREADLVVCVSQEVADAVVAMGASPSSTIVAPCTADSIRAWTGNATESKAALGIASSSIVVGWVGSFRPFHNAEDVVRAVAAVQDEGDVVLLMVGDGPSKSRCVSLATELGIQHSIFTGSVSHNDIPGLVSAMDIGVVPSSAEESFHYSPLKLKEYLAAGVAVVAPAVGEIERMLTDGVDAFLYPVGDTPGMAQQLREALTSDERRIRIASQGQATYDSSFTMEGNLRMILRRLGLDQGGQQQSLHARPGGGR